MLGDNIKNLVLNKLFLDKETKRWVGVGSGSSKDIMTLYGFGIRNTA